MADPPVRAASFADEVRALPPRRGAIDRFTIDTHAPTCCCPFTDPEAVGFSLAASSPGAAVMAGIFVSAALLELAAREAGCGAYFDADDDELLD